MVYISFVFKFFGMTQRRALICCSVHFIPLLIRRVVRVDRTFTDVHIHMHKYIHKYIFIYTCVCVFIYYIYVYICQGTLLLLWSQHLPTHTYYTYGALVVPRATASAHRPPPCPTCLLQPSKRTHYPVPVLRLGLGYDRGRGLGRLLLSLSLHSAVAFGFVVRHARFV